MIDGFQGFARWLDRIALWACIAAGFVLVAMVLTNVVLRYGFGSGAIEMQDLAGYAFAVYEFRFKKQLFAMVVGSMMLPSFLNMIPSFMVMDLLGWLDQPRALYIPGAAGALGIFMAPPSYDYDRLVGIELTDPTAGFLAERVGRDVNLERNLVAVSDLLQSLVGLSAPRCGLDDGCAHG